jgi:hypothetical protein
VHHHSQIPSGKASKKKQAITGGAISHEKNTPSQNVTHISTLHH